MQTVFPHILIMEGRQGAGRNNMMLMYLPVGITKDRGSFAGLFVFLQDGFKRGART